MSEESNINIEKDYLVIHRDMQGNFAYYSWYFADRITKQELDEKIIKWNESQKIKENGQPAELITDQLVKEVCAYRSRVHPLDEIIKEAEEIQGSINRAKEFLESALGNLNRVKGLE